MAEAVYGTVADATTYHAARGHAAWAEGTADDQAGALLRAASYIDGVYREQFPGRKVGGRAQEREWPRAGATDKSGEPIAADDVPREVVYAAYEAALREVAAPGSLSPDFVAAEQIKRETIGPLTTEYAVGNGGDAAAVRPVVSVIDDIIAPVLRKRVRLPAVMVA